MQRTHVLIIGSNVPVNPGTNFIIIGKVLGHDRRKKGGRFTRYCRTSSVCLTIASIDFPALCVGDSFDRSLASLDGLYEGFIFADGSSSPLSYLVCASLVKQAFPVVNGNHRAIPDSLRAMSDANSTLNHFWLVHPS
jgi:hypothetical protein